MADTNTHSPRDFASWFLARLGDAWPSPMRETEGRLGTTPAEAEKYARAYALDQYRVRVRTGTPLGFSLPDLTGKEVLELGCGHGGVSCWLAAIGSRRVVGIDINVGVLDFARRLRDEMSAERGVPLPVEFAVGNAMQLDFPENSFDAVYADNAFEHWTDPEQVMRESFRILRPGGVLIVPKFSAIRSRQGLHLKHGLKVPWANLLFSEKTIIAAVRRRAERDPGLYEIYPGLRGNPTRVRDLRAHGDLNDISHREFCKMAERVGFKIEIFKVHALLPGRAILKFVPGMKLSPVLDVLSTGGGGVLRKPK